MRTNHQLAKLKAHSLGNVAVFGNSYENGIFSKVNTFGGVPKAIKAQRAHRNNMPALISRGDSLSDNFILSDEPDTIMLQEPSNLGSGPASAAYFGSDPSFVRKEGGIMNSVTTFGNADNEHPSHMPQYLAGGGGTILALLAGYFALKWTRRI